MRLDQIFQKPVDRPIEGVIKADDESALLTEIEEYVITNEAAKRLEEFFGAYTTYEGANGAWISGFFGSGKSHLLKMLALILENRAINGSRAADLFLPKLEGNAILKGAVKKAVSIPSKSILFNIDQKADVITNAESDALLSVFVKVFDEFCGYYGKQGYIAQFERDLDKLGLFDPFKQIYQQISGKDWETGRIIAGLEKANIDKAYAQLPGKGTGNNGGILDHYRKDYKVSIEDFALLVKEYIEKQEPGFRLNFFVDEVGQFIANNIRLMTNLQTIAESLATKCNGRAWLIVTAQEDLNSIVGEMKSQQENDFTKIQDRFKTRLKLTSQNVDEVIQRRLLSKNPAGETFLETVYQQQVNNFGTLFDFTDGARTYRNYRDQQHFINSYPFIPYQFKLFQTTIENLSLHAAFEGRHSSVGERSMLAVFQQVVIHISSREVGQLATFDLMFEGISTAIKAQIQQAVLTAQGQLDSQLAIRLLKALFLVKYVKEFKATVHNLSILMLERFGQDQQQLRQEVEEALDLLVQQSYIQRNGEFYEFLTNDEKDIELEIKHVEIELDAIADELAKVVFDNIIRDRKIRHEQINQDYPFTRKLDDRIIGRESELAIHIASPFHRNFANEDMLRMQAMGRDELLVILPNDSRLMEDLMMYKRTDKYIQQNNTAAQTESISRILSDKAQLNSERHRQIEVRLKELLASAKFILAGSEITINSADPQTRVISAFRELIRVTYPNLRMLHGINYTESDIETYLRSTQPTLLGGEAVSIDEAAQELLTTIQANQRTGLRTTLKGLDDRFEKKPYGWPLPAVLCNLAKLCAHGKVEVRADGNLLEDAILARALRNTQAHSNTILEPVVEFTAAQVRQLKEFFEDFFDKPPSGNEARELAKETGAALDDQRKLLETINKSASQYPFLIELSGPISKLKEVSGKAYTFYLTDLPRFSEELLDLKERITAPILSFWNGPHKVVYDEARQFYQYEKPNFDKLEGPEPAQFEQLLISETLTGNGNIILPLNALMVKLKAGITQQLNHEREQAHASVSQLRSRLEGMDEFTHLEPQQQEQIRDHFTAFLVGLDQQTLIAVIRDNLHNFEDVRYTRLLEQITNWEKSSAKAGQPTGSSQPVSERKVEYVSRHKIAVDYDKAYLDSEEDLDRYLQAVRSALLKQIQLKKRIQI